MASILKVDALQGITAAGDITVTSEGGAATQSLQQGLAKAWVNFSGSGTIAARDSLNVSGLVDDGTGNYDINFSNNMNNDDYVLSGAAFARIIGMADNEFFTSYANIRVHDTSGSSSDAGTITSSILGDLA